jgi:hypothetical protein
LEGRYFDQMRYSGLRKARIFAARATTHDSPGAVLLLYNQTASLRVKERNIFSPASHPLLIKFNIGVAIADAASRPGRGIFLIKKFPKILNKKSVGTDFWRASINFWIPAVPLVLVFLYILYRFRFPSAIELINHASKFGFKRPLMCTAGCVCRFAPR